MGTVGIQAGAKVATLLTAILFARVLGPEDYGRYGIVMSIITLAVLPTIAGLPQLIVREIAKYRINGEYSLLRGMLIWSNRYVLIFSLLSMVFIYLLVKLGLWDSQIGSLILYAVFLIPIKGLLSRQGAILNGFQQPELAQLPTLVLAPISALIITCGVYYFLAKELDSKILIYVQTTAHLGAVLIGLFLVRFIVNNGSKTSSPCYQIKGWHTSLLPFTFITIVGTMNSELATVLLGFLGSEESVGYFRVAVTGTTVLALSLTAVNTVSGPKIASMYNRNELDLTQDILSRSVKLSSMCSLPLAVLLFFFGEHLVVFLFGPNYKPAALLLSIMCIGQIFNILCGSVGLVLNMTGNERFALRAQVVNLILTIILLVILVPLYQGVGAAIAISTGLICWNVLMACDVYRLTGLKTWLRF